jgi:AcrR family transcriptional regulator
LIDAATHCLALHGVGGISVRMVAARAGVSAGLLTHYFTGIDALILAAYHATTARITAVLAAAAAAVGDHPRDRLSAYVAANFQPPISDPELLATWSAFWALAAAKPEMAAAHKQVYAATRTDIEAMLAGCGVTDVRLAAIGLNAVIDGLWLEYSLDPDVFTAADAAQIADRWLRNLIDG